MTSNSIDPKFFNQVAQLAHFFAGATVYLSIGLFSFRWALYLTPVGIGLAAIKEFWYDAHDENAATRGSDAEDFTFYLVGIGYALALVALVRDVLPWL